MHRVLVVGGGSIGERHLRCFLNTGRAQVAVVDNRPDRLKQLAAAYPVSGTYTDFNQVDLSKFDAAVICVYADLHIPWALRVVEAGRHVLIEKPLAIKLDGAEELERAIARRGVVAGVAHVRRHMSASRVLKQEFASGRIGDVLAASYVLGYDHREARPDYRSTYWTSHDMGGGAVYDIGSHLVNLIQWILGPVRSVSATYEHLVMEDVEPEDTVSMTLRFRSHPTIATIHLLTWQAHRTDQFILSGVNGSIVCDAWEGKVGTFLRGKDWRWQEGLKAKPDAKGQTDEPFLDQATRFLDAIEGKAQVLCTVAEARHTIEVCAAAYESGRRRGPVEIQPKDEVIGG